MNSRKRKKNEFEDSDSSFFKQEQILEKLNIHMEEDRPNPFQWWYDKEQDEEMLAFPFVLEVAPEYQGIHPITIDDIRNHLISFLNINPQIKKMLIDAEPVEDSMNEFETENHSRILNNILTLNPNNITSLYLDGNQIGDNGAIIFATNPKLNELSLVNCNISDEGAKALSKSSLRKLNLSENIEIGDEGAKTLAESQSIEDLNLSHTRIGDEGAATLVYNKKLRKLNLSYCRILNSPKAFIRNNTLEILIVDNNQINDVGVAEFSVSNLNALSLFKNNSRTKLTIEGEKSISIANFSITSNLLPEYDNFFNFLKNPSNVFIPKIIPTQFVHLNLHCQEKEVFEIGECFKKFENILNNEHIKNPNYYLLNPALHLYQLEVDISVGLAMHFVKDERLRKNLEYNFITDQIDFMDYDMNQLYYTYQKNL